MAKSAIESAKDFMERILVQIRIPKIVQNPTGSGISFQMDDPAETNAQIPECKECKMNSSDALVGAWHVVLWSHNFLITVISDLNSQIDKLAANQPLPDQRSLFEWFADPPGVICPQLI
uniref:Uncharacterized protein n=2 Tax=Panagrolaimus sp. PS1159 TaxID=55785 RepID=A0AC35FWH9_9BILA